METSMENAEDIIQKNESVNPVKRFFMKYFLQGQKLSAKHEFAVQNLDPNAPWHKRVFVTHRRFIAMIIPCTFFCSIWFLHVFRHFDYYADIFPKKYVMSLTMIFGSMVAGATSEGGGAVAFPVMTLALKVPPSVARDFSLMCQSFGMVTAGFCIVFMKVKVEWRSIIFCSIGAFFGLILGLEVIDGILEKEVKKLSFVSIWFSFCVALFLLNREHKRVTYDSIQNFGVWQALVLILVGFIGGMFTGVAGSGTDICSFAILSLLFRISEKISTPTSVILMAINTVTGFFWRQFLTYKSPPEQEAWDYLAVVVPFVVTFGPIGAFLSSYCHRQVLAALIYILDTLALITALAVIPMKWEYWVLVESLIVGGGVLFVILGHLGQKLIRTNNLKYESANGVKKESNEMKTLHVYENKLEMTDTE